MQPSGIISLITDFGLTDSYVGQMKGALLRQNPAVRLIDISHAIPRQNISEAAIVLHSSYAFFPSGTVHLLVVDPGVGSQRRILAAEGDGHYFAAPDNGIFSLLLRDHILSRIYLVEKQDFFAETVSSTFHGRDIMAPVAAALAGGLPLAALGPKVSPDSCVCLDLPVARISEKRVTGQVLRLDHFGNIRTTIRRENLKHHQVPCRVRLNGKEITTTISKTYADAEPGELIALIDSDGYLEIAVNTGNAAEQTGCRIGDPIHIEYSDYLTE